LKKQFVADKILHSPSEFVQDQVISQGQATTVTSGGKVSELHHKEHHGRPLSQVIRDKMKSNGKRFWAGDNISD
jgi:hypothetical protein